jgi:hypothetical protein
VSSVNWDHGGFSAAFGLGLDETFVLQQLERGVDRAGARPPDAAGAAFQLLNHFVAVHRPLEQQREKGGADIGPAAATAAAWASVEATAWAAERATETAGGSAAERESGRESEAAPAALATECSATEPRAAEHVGVRSVPHDYLRSVVDS